MWSGEARCRKLQVMIGFSCAAFSRVEVGESNVEWGGQV